MLIRGAQYDLMMSALFAGSRRLAVAFAALAVACALGAGLSVWLVAGGGSSAASRPKEDPVAFLRGIVSSIAANDYEHVWPSLHPAQQRVATRGLYVRCERLDPVVGELKGITVVRALDERIAVAGAGDDLVDSKAVTFRLKLSDVTGESFGLVTVHAVAVQGHWRWILTPDRFAVYRSGGCPTTPPPPQSA